MFEQESRVAEHWFSNGQIGKALPHFRRAMLIDPRSHQMKLRIGQCLDRMGRTEEASVMFEDLVGPDFDGIAQALQGEILQAYTNLCHRTGRESAVLDCLRPKLAMIERLPALYYNLGLALYKSRQMDEARDCFLRLKILHPKHSAGYIGQAILQCHANRFAEALEELESGRRAVPHDVQIFENIAVVHMKMGNPLASITILRSLIERGMRSAKLLHMLGMAHLRLGNLPTAETHLKQSLDIERTGDALREMGWLLIAKGLHAESIVYLKEALTINPNDIWAKLDLAIAYFKQGITVDAHILFNEARAAAPSPEVTKLLDDLARVIAAGPRS